MILLPFGVAPSRTAFDRQELITEMKMKAYAPSFTLIKAVKVCRDVKLIFTYCFISVCVLQVFTNANVIYWRQRETMHSGACGVKKAAHDLHNTIQAVRDVDSAFASVDLRCNRNDWINLVAAD